METCDCVRPGVPRTFWPLPMVGMIGIAPLIAPLVDVGNPETVGSSVPALNTPDAPVVPVELVVLVVRYGWLPA